MCPDLFQKRSLTNARHFDQPSGTMNAHHIRELGQAALSGSLAFPEIVARLIAEGVECCHVDDVIRQISFYSGPGGVVLVPLSFEQLPAVAENFDAAGLRDAIADSQTHGQSFRDFSRRATQAGVMGYLAFLRGQRATYFGMQGDQHTELFVKASRVQV